MSQLRNKQGGVTGLGFIALLLASRVFADALLEPAMQCEALRDVDFSSVVDAPTQVTAVTSVQAQADAPAYCRVEGYVAPSVGVEVRLPASSNGKFMQIGCGGHCGEMLFASSCDSALRKGYACLVSDMGHRGTAVDGVWAYHNLQAQLDWGYRATHVATLAGKAITERYYGQAPRKSYFMGCSTGGRQALQEAQRFPWDFDGILAGAPPIDLSMLYLQSLWGHRVLQDASGKALLGDVELNLLTEAVLARCDLDDGVKDGIVSDPTRCRFDPSALACRPGQTELCLTAQQLEAVKKLYRGPTNSRGEPLTPGGMLLGSESNAWKSHSDRDGAASSANEIFANGFRYLFFWPEPGPSWQPSDLDFDRDYKRTGLMQVLVDSSNPDLRRFQSAGGKLLIYQGLRDSIIARQAIDYYQMVERTMGGRKVTQEFVRLFLLPGVGHCSGGPGADAADFLGALEGWVEQGKAPDRILAGHLKEEDSSFAYPYRPFPQGSDAVKFTRPLYPFPIKAVYSGRGDPNDAKNFEPRVPESR